MNQEHSFSHPLPHIKSKEKKCERSISEELEHYSKDSDSDELFSSPPCIPWLEVKTYKNSHKKIPILDRWTIADCQKQLDNWYNNAEQRTHHIEESLHYLKRLHFLFEKGTKGDSSLAVFRPCFARDNKGYYDLHGFSIGTAYYFLIEKTKGANHLPPLKNTQEIGLHSRNNEDKQSLIKAIKQVCNYRRIKFTLDKNNEYDQHIDDPVNNQSFMSQDKDNGDNQNIDDPMNNQSFMSMEYQHYILALKEKQHLGYMEYPPIFYPSPYPYFISLQPTLLMQSYILIPQVIPIESPNMIYPSMLASHQYWELHYFSEAYTCPPFYYAQPTSYQEPQQFASHNSYSEASSQIIKNASESNIAFFKDHSQKSDWNNNVSTHNNHNTSDSRPA